MSKILQVRNSTKDFNSYRAARVKSLFNAENGSEFNFDIEVDLSGEWTIGVIVGPSGSGKTSLGSLIFDECGITNLYEGWEDNKPIIDCIAPDGDFNDVTGALANVGFELFRKSNGLITNKEISQILSVPEKTISAWKSRDGWNIILQNKNVNTTNNNCSIDDKDKSELMVGTSENGVEKKLQNYVKNSCGTVLFSILSDEEKDIYRSLDIDPYIILSEEIKFLQLRKLRIIKELKKLEENSSDTETQHLKKLCKIKTPIKQNGKTIEIPNEVLKDVQISQKQYRKLDDIIALEEVLNKITGQLIKLIKQLNDLKK